MASAATPSSSTTKSGATMAAANKAYWETHAASTMYAQPWIQALTAQVRTFLQTHISFLGLTPHKPAHILDYACALGTVSQALLTQADLPDLHATGVDVSPAMLAEYARVLTTAGVAADRFAAAEADLVAEAERSDAAVAAIRPDLAGFDAVVVGLALHHMQDFRTAIRRLAQRVRPGGVLCVVDWDLPADAEAAQGKEPPSYPSMQRGEGGGHGHGQHQHGHGHGHAHGHRHGHDINDAVAAHEAAGDTIAHVAFSRRHLEEAFAAAGCDGFDYVVLDRLEIPFAKPDDAMGGVWRVGVSRAVRRAEPLAQKM